MPVSEAELLSTVPVPLPLTIQVIPPQPPGRLSTLPIHYHQHVLDEVLLLLAHNLSHHPVVSHAASHRLKPGQPVVGGGRAVRHVVVVLYNHIAPGAICSR